MDTDLVVDDADDQPGSPQPIEGKCGSKLPGRDRYCMKEPMADRTRCYKHGGKTPVGALSPHFKHGQRSRHMPARIAQRFELAHEDPELLSTRNSSAIVQARIDELLERVYSGESGFAWKQLGKLWADFRRFRAAGNVPKMQETLELIDEPMRLGLADHAAWEELGFQLDRHARLADQEQKRLDKIQATMTVEEAMGLLGTVLDVLRRHVADEATLDAIGAELEQLVSLDAGPLLARGRRRRR
jgi:hypothetical protein